MMSSSHSTNWRGISSSEVKSVIGNNGASDSISTRAYSAAVRALKPKGSSTITTGNGIIIPKVSLKKKSPHNAVALKNSAGANFRTIQGKTSQSSQSNSKSHMHEGGGNPRRS